MHRIVRVLRLCSDYTHYQSDLTKRFGSIRGSKLLERRCSVAAAAVSKDTKAMRVGRVPKNERRAMVEAYVIEYTTTNNGKFPTPSETKEQIGGAYYTIKNILQEIQHRSKLPPTNSKQENALRKEATDINESPTDGAAISVSNPETIEDDDIYSAYSDIKSVGSEVVKPITEVHVNDCCHSTLIAEKESKASGEEAVKPKTIVDGDNVDPNFSKFKGIVVEEEPKDATLLREPLAEEVITPKTTVDISSYNGKQMHELEVEHEKSVKHLHPESVGAEVVIPTTEVDVNNRCHPSLIAEKESEASGEEVVKPKTIVDGDNVDPDFSKFKGIVVEEEPKDATLLREILAEEVIKPKTTADISSYTGKQNYEIEVEPEKVVKHLNSGKSEHNEEERLPPENPHPPKLQHKASSEPDKLAMVNFEKPTDNEELPKQSLWRSLKSFAGDFMKTLRGM